MDQIDALVVGAGVVGLATARALALLGLEVIIIEREPHYGSGISSRNSEVIHAGHYYDTGSLKARMCVRGRHLMMDYCQARQLPHRSCGKLVVASLETDLPKLQALWQRGQANGVEDLSILSGQEARRLEPALAVAAALHSPRTGIVDSHAFMTALLGDAEGAGACLAVQTRFVRALKREGRWTVQTEGAEAFAVSTRLLVNCAGLGAQAVSHGIEGLLAQHTPPLHLAKGNYFALSGRSPFSRLIYPLPVDGGLGTHLTLDMAGQARFGPDVQWLPDGTVESSLDYAVPAERQTAFEHDIRRWWPSLPPNALLPAYSGVRPKLSARGAAAADFCISGPAQHGLAGLVNLFGIESPGLTASMALAEAVVEALSLG